MQKCRESYVDHFCLYHLHSLHFFNSALLFWLEVNFEETSLEGALGNDCRKDDKSFVAGSEVILRIIVSLQRLPVHGQLSSFVFVSLRFDNHVETLSGAHSLDVLKVGNGAVDICGSISAWVKSSSKFGIIVHKQDNSVFDVFLTTRSNSVDGVVQVGGGLFRLHIAGVKVRLPVVASETVDKAGNDVGDEVSGNVTSVRNGVGFLGCAHLNGSH